MKRLLTAAVLVFLLSLSIPALRARAMPKYRALGAWAWGHLEGPLTPVLTPWRTARTKADMATVVNHLVTWRNRGFPPPTEEQFPRFMMQAGLDSTSTDRWGGEYDLVFQPDSVFVRSPGPDGERETEDDLLVGVRYDTGSRAGRMRR